MAKCPSCNREGPDGDGCPTCPGFWYQDESITKDDPELQEWLEGEVN